MPETAGDPQANLPSTGTTSPKNIYLDIPAQAKPMFIASLTPQIDNYAETPLTIADVNAKIDSYSADEINNFAKGASESFDPQTIEKQFGVDVKTLLISSDEVAQQQFLNTMVLFL